MEALPGGQPGVPAPGDGAGAPPPRRPLTARTQRWLAWLGVAVAGSIALGLATSAGVKGRGGLADAAHVAIACLVLFTIVGFAPTRLFLPAGLRRHELVWVLPVGAVGAALELALLVYAFVPFNIALGLVLAAGLGLGAYAWRRDPGLPLARSAREAGVATSWRTLLVPLYLAVLIGAIALIPMFRSGFATVIGNGSDAHLAVGTATFLQRHAPNAVAIDEPVDRVPLVWRSKPPIYLAFGAVARLAGMEPYKVLATLQAALLALGALGFWLLARELLGASAWAAAGAMGLVGLNRIALFTGMHPYFNQTWGYMALSFSIVLAWYAVRRRSRGGLLLFASFLGVLVFAYPLAMPVPLIAAIIFWGFERRRQGRSLLRIPRLRNKKNLLWIIPLFFLLLLPLQGVLEKVSVSLRVLLPGHSLVNWGGDLTGFFPERFFLGFDSAATALPGMILLGVGLVLALRAAPRELRWGLGGVVIFGILCALYFRPREYGWYFHFKALAFVAPLAVTLGVAGLARLRWTWVTIVAMIFLVGATRTGAAHQIGTTFDQLPKSLLALRAVDARLPPTATLRLDMPADGRQLWAGILLAGQPLCSQKPVLGTSYPHVPISRRADYVLVDNDWRKPVDAVGPPVMTLERYTLFHLRPDLPNGPDTCSRKMVLTVTQLSAGAKPIS
ncbi:MAG TPA: hypothetical protein VHZ75_06475 [Solirubrobacteraceae bacterium]|nr:hypothetical protein [Solirubrobacteraceae bacterium]